MQIYLLVVQVWFQIATTRRHFLWHLLGCRSMMMRQLINWC
ncbi:hypothetical protein ACHAW6_003907 [Cyclotella cf. meneghiniana]